MKPAIVATIPTPIQIVIDDVGWWSGEDGSERQEPYRTGVGRNHVPADYEAVVSLGHQLNMRPQAAFVLCEWDKSNILRELPSSTWLGEHWDNSRWVGKWQEEASALVRDNSRHIELTLHGVGHEYWADCAGEWKSTRAEWADETGQMRPRDEVLLHLEYFQKLLNQHDLGPFPASFVPCAFRHGFDKSRAGFSAILRQFGVRFMSTPFGRMRGFGQTEHELIGFQNGIMTVDRGRDLAPWNAIGYLPQDELISPICGLHWPNILHPDPGRNEEIVMEWVRYLQKYQQRADSMLAPDTFSFATQLAHHCFTSTKVEDDKILLDFAAFFQLPYDHFEDSMALKILSPIALGFAGTGIEILSIEEASVPGGILYTVNVHTRAECPRAQLAWAPAGVGSPRDMSEKCKSGSDSGAAATVASWPS